MRRAARLLPVQLAAQAVQYSRKVLMLLLLLLLRHLFMAVASCA
jgi:hypothetical protein